MSATRINIRRAVASCLLIRPIHRVRRPVHNRSVVDTPRDPEAPTDHLRSPVDCISKPRSSTDPARELAIHRPPVARVVGDPRSPRRREVPRGAGDLSPWASAEIGERDSPADRITGTESVVEQVLARDEVAAIVCTPGVGKAPELGHVPSTTWTRATSRPADRKAEPDRRDTAGQVVRPGRASDCKLESVCFVENPVRAGVPA